MGGWKYKMRTEFWGLRHGDKILLFIDLTINNNTQNYRWFKGHMLRLFIFGSSRRRKGRNFLISGEFSHTIETLIISRKHW